MMKNPEKKSGSSMITVLEKAIRLTCTCCNKFVGIAKCKVAKDEKIRCLDGGGASPTYGICAECVEKLIGARLRRRF